jgi:high-affinity Fe2+/Pb2+ permease
MNKIQEEPILVASLVAAIMSFIAMGVALGWWGLDTEQMGTIREFLQSFLPLLVAVIVLAGGWWGRQRVVSVRKLKRNNIAPSRLV